MWQQYLAWSSLRSEEKMKEEEKMEKISIIENSDGLTIEWDENDPPFADDVKRMTKEQQGEYFINMIKTNFGKIRSKTF